MQPFAELRERRGGGNQFVILRCRWRIATNKSKPLPSFPGVLMLAHSIWVRTQRQLLNSFLPSPSKLLLFIHFFYRSWHFCDDALFLLFPCGKLKGLWFLTFRSKNVYRSHGLEVVWSFDLGKWWECVDGSQSSHFLLYTKGKSRSLKFSLTSGVGFFQSGSKKEKKTWFYVIHQTMTWSGHCDINFRFQKNRSRSGDLRRNPNSKLTTSLQENCLTSWILLCIL